MQLKDGAIMQTEQIVAKIVRWGKLGGKIKKWANGANRSNSKPMTMYSTLASNARAYGWLNGKRLPKKGR